MLEGAMRRTGVITAGFAAAKVWLKTWKLRRYALLVACLVTYGPVAVSLADAAETKRVMLLHSFGRDFKPWSDYARSIREELERQSPWPLDITDHSLVTARSSDEDPEPAFVEYLRATFVKRPPDLIVSIGAPATAFVQRHRERLFATTPMVFTAVEQRRVQQSRLTANDAPVPVWINYRAAFENILHVLPATQNIIVVVGSSPIEKFWKEAIGKEVEPLAGRVALSWTDRLSFEELLKQAAALPPHTAIFWELMIVDGAGVIHEGSAPLKKLHAVANAPIFSYDESFFGGEIVGGPLLRVIDTSRQAAAVAVRILGGERAGDIKLPPVAFARPQFDWREMRRWGISESNLPLDSLVLYREPTVWHRYRVQILAVVALLLLQGALIAWLLYEHWRRQAAEARSIQQMAEIARMNRLATAGQLSASIAHEIRQPLAAIASSGSAGLNWLNKTVPDLEEARIALQTVVRQCHRADDVIKGVRAMFSHDSSVRIRVNLNELVEQVLALTSRNIAANSIELNTKLMNNPPPLVMADPIQLQQLVLNLIVNAVEAMGAFDGTRTLNIETRIDQAGYVILTIADSGPGFDATVAANLFSPFVSTKARGMGMGLPICKSIAEQHGGQLIAVSIKPHGAVLTAVLPGLG
jgi:signal transduction histidine kinase